MAESDTCFCSAQDKLVDELVFLCCPEFRECGCLEEHIFGKLQETFDRMQDALLLARTKKESDEQKPIWLSDQREVNSAAERHFFFITFSLPR